MSAPALGRPVDTRRPRVTAAMDPERLSDTRALLTHRPELADVVTGLGVVLAEGIGWSA